MAKVAPDAMLDASLDYVAGSTELYLCVGEPTDRADADAKSLIPVHTMDGADFSKANGDTSGRKVTVAAQNGLTADANGSPDHVCLCDNSVIRYITTCTPQAVTDGNDVNIGAWDVEIADPT